MSWSVNEHLVLRTFCAITHLAAAAWGLARYSCGKVQYPGSGWAPYSAGPLAWPGWETERSRFFGFPLETSGPARQIIDARKIKHVLIKSGHSPYCLCFEALGVCWPGTRYHSEDKPEEGGRDRSSLECRSRCHH